MTEATEVENPVVEWCKKHKILTRKMNGMGSRGWPDRLICIPITPLWIEFKRKGEKLRKLQVHRIKELRKLGYDIEVHDDKEEAIAAIKKRIKAREVEAKSCAKEGAKRYAKERVLCAVPRSRTRKD